MAFFAFGLFELDMRRFELRRSGISHPIEPKAFDILVHLILNRDRVVSKEELLSHFWLEEFVSESVLTRSINLIRQALDDDGNRQHTIKTIRRRGYHFVAAVEECSEETAPPADQGEVERSAIPEVDTSERWQCSVCRHDNLLDDNAPDGICSQCGTSRQLSCPKCQGANPPQAKFCLNCGQALEAPQPVASLTPIEDATEPPSQVDIPEPEHRQLTVLSIDLVNALTLSTQMAAGDVRHILTSYWEACSDTIQRFDGHMAQNVGTKILAFFGYPQAHEDDARRAVYAGLDLLRVLKSILGQLTQDRAIDLAVRLGIHTGPVVAGDLPQGEAHETLLLGDAPDIAIKIQGMAAPGTLVISGTTAQLVEGYFIWDQLDKQLEEATPTSLFRVIATSAARSRLDVVRVDKLTPLVGRQAEFELLKERWTRAREGMGQVVLLSGEAGIGKSRLVEALKSDLPTHSYTLIEGRCSPYDQHSVFYPIIDRIRDVLDWEQDDADEVRLAKLEQLLARYDQPLEEVAPLLAALISLPLSGDKYPSLQLSPQQQRQKTLQALLSWVLALASDRPAFFIVEDLHWIDPSTLDFLTLLIDHVPATSICALFTHRPEFQVPWKNRSYITSVTLPRLSRQEVAPIVSHIARGKRLPSDVLFQIEEQTDGVPLFIEECTKTVLESGSLQESEDRYELIDSLPALTIPGTLQDSLIARLDQLDSAKSIAQIGAVLGRRFSYLLIRAVTPQDEHILSYELSHLVESELIYQQGVPPNSSYMFKHALIQEAAYQSLLKSTRQHYHHQTADVLAEQFAEIAGSQPELLAHHYEAAGLNAQAIQYWQRAGRHALGRSAYVEAIRHFQRGLALIPFLEETDAQISQEIALQNDIGRAFMAIKGFGAPEVAEAYNRAQILCRELPDSPRLFSILRGLATYYFIRAEYATALELGKQCLGLAKQLEDPVLFLRAYLTVGQNEMFLGNLVEGHDYFSQGISEALASTQSDRAVQAIQDPYVTCCAMDGITMWLLGYPEQGRQRSEQAIQLARELKHPFSLAEALVFATLGSMEEQEGEEAERYSREVIALSEAHDFPHWKAHGQIYYGRALALQGQVDTGLEQIRLGLDQWQAIGGILSRPVLLSYLARAYFQTGDLEKAVATVTEALQLVEAQNERYYEAELNRLRGECLRHQHAEAYAAEAERCFQRALEFSSAQQTKVFELRARMSLCRLWREQGKSELADRVLEEGYHWFTEGFHTIDLRAAQTLLTNADSHLFNETYI